MRSQKILDGRILKVWYTVTYTLYSAYQIDVFM